MSVRYRNSGAAFKKRDRKFETVNKVLGSTLRKFGLDNEIARYRFVLHWAEIVGEDIAKRTKPECLKNNALVVRVQNSVWAQELTFQKDLILGKLQNYLDEKDLIKDVIFYVGQ